MSNVFLHCLQTLNAIHRNELSSVTRGVVFSANHKREITILLVGETGVGKTSVLNWIANTLLGVSPGQYDLQIHDAANEAGGSGRHSQTNRAQKYTLTSRNGFAVHILDTPGLADTRGLAQDDMHKKSISEAIKSEIPAVDAVLILANGTLPRLSVGADYTLTTLTSIFPRTIANNIGVLITNVPDELSCNFEVNSLPQALLSAHVPLFMLDNPIARERKFRDLQQDPQKRLRPDQRERMRMFVQETHKKALNVFVELFDWIDQRTLQPTKDIMSLYEKTEEIEQHISETLANLKQTLLKSQELASYMMQIEKAKAVSN